jgi:membrane protein YqaA with SNARE-associated domain
MLPEMHVLIFLFFLSIISASIIPAQAELVTFAFLISGKYTPWLLILVACLGTLSGTSLNWLLGRYLSQFEEKRWFPIKKIYIEKARNLFDKHGKITLGLAGIPLIGDPITIVAGAAKVDFGFYMLVAGLAKCARFGVVWLLYKGVA